MEQITLAAVGHDVDNLSYEINKAINWARAEYSDRDVTVNSITPIHRHKGEDLKVLVLFDLSEKELPPIYAGERLVALEHRVDALASDQSQDRDDFFHVNNLISRFSDLEIEAQRSKDFANGLLARLEALEDNRADERNFTGAINQRVAELEQRTTDLLNPIDAAALQIGHHSKEIHELKHNLSNTNIGLQEVRKRLEAAEELVQELSNSPRN